MSDPGPGIRFARITFFAAGIYGLLVITPLYFLEARIGRDAPPAITHPEFFYGFTGSALVWQFVYLLIGSDPTRFRPVMLLGVLAKVAYGATALILFVQHRLATSTFAVSAVDLLLALLFFVSYIRTQEPAAS